MNSQGNTIVHQIMKVPYSTMALDVVMLVCSYLTGASVCDSDGSLKKLCTKLGAKDQRVEYVKSILQLHSDASTEEIKKMELLVNASPKTTVPDKNVEGNSLKNKKPSEHFNDGIRVAEVIIDKQLTINECIDFVNKHLNKMESFVYDLSHTYNFGADNQNHTDVKPDKIENNEHYKLNADELAVEEELNTEIIEPISDKIGKEFNTNIFDGLEWEVECTENIWKWLSKKMLRNLKLKLVLQIRQLASGNWSTVVHKRLEHIPKGVYLYETKLSKAARIIWQMAIAFSERSSHSTLTTSKTNSEVKGAIYTEVIRVWDVVLNHDHLSATIERIVKSISRGEQCMLHKNLRKQTSIMVPDKQSAKKLPHFWIEADINRNSISQDNIHKLCPPGSADDREYHIVKFYSFNSQLISSLLQNQANINVEFPFHVTELEHAIINLKHDPPAPIILLGRSGTGKTTCCLYRLWSRFIHYWTQAKAGGPLIPRTIEFKSKGKI